MDSGKKKIHEYFPQLHHCWANEIIGPVCSVEYNNVAFTHNGDCNKQMVQDILRPQIEEVDPGNCYFQQ